MIVGVRYGRMLYPILFYVNVVEIYSVSGMHFYGIECVYQYV